MIGMILVVLATAVLLAVAFNFDDGGGGERADALDSGRTQRSGRP